MKIVIAGAGSIGCFCGGLLALAGHEVTLFGRPRVLDAIASGGLQLTDFSGLDHTIDASQLVLADKPSCLGSAELIIVTVKSGATPDMAELIADHSRTQTPVISWQNGTDNARLLRAALSGRDVRAGMVPFNVVPKGPAHYHRATSGNIMIEAGPGKLGQALSSDALFVQESDKIEAVQWGKLVLNLNNALNALSGLPLQQQLRDRRWRRVMADQMGEALEVLKAAQIPVASTTPLPAWMTPIVLRLPTPMFSRIAARMLTIDPEARTSMSYDLMAGRVTEIDSLQGQIIRLGERVGVPTPINARVAALIDGRPKDPIGPDQI